VNAHNRHSSALQEGAPQKFDGAAALLADLGMTPTVAPDAVAEPLATFLMLAKRGACLFPLYANRKDATPTAWDKTASNDPAKIKRHYRKGCRAFGIATGPSGLLVADADIKNGPDGIANLRAVAGGNAADLDATFSAKTRSGGIHFYFLGKVPEGKLRGVEAVDIKSSTGYVVAPGSVIRDAPIPSSTPPTSSRRRNGSSIMSRRRSSRSKDRPSNSTRRAT
jgi:hypothetical protein